MSEPEIEVITAVSTEAADYMGFIRQSYDGYMCPEIIVAILSTLINQLLVRVINGIID